MKMNTAISYTIPAIPPSNNKYIGRNNRFEYQADKKQWAAWIDLFCKPKPVKPLTGVTVTLTYYFATKTRRDPDNYSGKMILDGLVRCGILADDSFGCIKLQLIGRYDKDQPRTEIGITEV